MDNLPVMRVEQLGQLFERARNGGSHGLELYWVDPDGAPWQIYGHGQGSEEIVPQKVFWIPPGARAVHHADPHLKKILKKIRFHDWVIGSRPGTYFQTKNRVIAVNGAGEIWQHDGIRGLQRLFWIPEGAQPVGVAT